MRREAAFLRKALQTIAELKEFVTQTSQEKFLADRM